MGRINLFVPPEEYAEVEALDACWDDASKRWYIDGDGASAAYSRWNYLLHAERGDVFFGLSRGEPGPVQFTSLEGRIELSGDFAFEV